MNTAHHTTKLIESLFELTKMEGPRRSLPHPRRLF